MNRRASDLDWGREVSSHLSPGEWPEGALDHQTAGIVLTLSDIREDTGRPAFPSPVYGAHVRHRPRRPGSSNGDRHSDDDGNRLSDGLDFFVRWEDAAAYLRAIQRHRRVGGLGIYGHMMRRGKPGDHCMFHIDNRPERMLWVGHGREPVEYVMEIVEPARYYRLIGEMLEAR